MTINDQVNAHATLSALEQVHRGGHACIGGWVPFRDTCPTRESLTALREYLDTLHGQVHAAAHDPETVDVVATAMLASTPLDELDPEQAEGWRHIARLAMEALAAHLDRSTHEDTGLDPDTYTVRPVRDGVTGNGEPYTETCDEADADRFAVYWVDEEGHEQWVSDWPTREEAEATAAQYQRT